MTLLTISPLQQQWKEKAGAQDKYSEALPECSLQEVFRGKMPRRPIILSKIVQLHKKKQRIIKVRMEGTKFCYLQKR